MITNKSVEAQVESIVSQLVDGVLPRILHAETVMSECRDQMLQLAARYADIVVTPEDEQAKREGVAACRGVVKHLDKAIAALRDKLEPAQDK